MALAVIVTSQSIFYFNLIIKPFCSLQTGEFSARFLLKLPVDFSNIPTYLLKVKVYDYQCENVNELFKSLFNSEYLHGLPAFCSDDEFY